MLSAATQPRRLTDADLAKLAWSILDETSHDPKYARQLTVEQWKQLAHFMANIVLMCEPKTEEVDV